MLENVRSCLFKSHYYDPYKNLDDLVRLKSHKIFKNH